uniref:Immunoglobulin domain-containing protein n=1 Tax=Astatotilapia calliptera TaxID=8154 RepID=A0A3P8Q833_ASTCA
MRSFVLITALIFCSLRWIFISGSEVHTVTVQRGEDVTLQCSNISTSPTHTEWFRVINTTKTSCISSMFGSHGQASFCNGFQNGKFNMSSNVTSVFLKMTEVGLSDVGLYFCGFYMDVHIIISNAVELRFEGGETNDEESKTEKEPERCIHLMSIVLGSLTGLLTMVVIVLVLKVRNLQTATEPKGEELKNMNSDYLNYAALSFQTKAKRSRRPATQSEPEPNVVYAATR